MPNKKPARKFIKLLLTHYSRVALTQFYIAYHKLNPSILFTRNSGLACAHIKPDEWVRNLSKTRQKTLGLDLKCLKNFTDPELLGSMDSHL